MHRKLRKLLLKTLAVVALFAVVGIAVLPGLLWLDHNRESRQSPSYPVVLIRAGLAALTTDYTAVAEDLASHGYIETDRKLRGVVRCAATTLRSSLIQRTFLYRITTALGRFGTVTKSPVSLTSCPRNCCDRPVSRSVNAYGAFGSSPRSRKRADS